MGHHGVSKTQTKDGKDAWKCDKCGETYTIFPHAMAHASQCNPEVAAKNG